MQFVIPGGSGGWSLWLLTLGVKEPSYATAGKIIFPGSEAVLNSEALIHSSVQ